MINFNELQPKAAIGSVQSMKKANETSQKIVN